MMENLVKFSGFYAGGQHRKEGSSPPAPPPPPPPDGGQGNSEGRGRERGSERTQFLRGWDFSLFTAETINFRIIV